ncbi:hypothetical protein [Streptosporangium sp. NPDC002524]|uniref:hypothetical protein n=1 Tax=Streptosporangium sp. NPDC002524 TaxID=3154537 RepID=UPI00331E8B89
MPVPPPAPSTLDDEEPGFSRALAQLYERAGRPTYAELIRRAAAQKPPVPIGKSSLSDWLGGVSIPSSPRVVEFLVTYLQPKASRRGHPPVMAPIWWEAQRARAQRARHANRGGRPTRRPVPGDGPHDGAHAPADGGLGWPIEQVDPIALGVHPAIDTITVRVALGGGARLDRSTLPVYISRAHDAKLAAVVAESRARGRSRMVVLVGGSSTGKTRACWEAVRQLGEPWRLWHPINPGWAQATLAGLEAVKPYTVVWLNELQHYLSTPGDPAGEQVAAGLRELLRTPGRGPVLVLGTLWPPYWAALTAVPAPGAADPHAGARTLLTGKALEVPAAFTAENLITADAVTNSVRVDLRLTEAMIRAPGGQLTQYLAGVPALIERYRTASAEAHAVLNAAFDARRLGHGPILPRLFLEEAATGYLSDGQEDLLDDDWLEQSFAYLTDARSCRGARPPLARIRSRPGLTTSPAAIPHSGEVSYRLADYLEQHGSRERRWECPPASFWESAARHATAADRAIMADAAHRRGRYRHAFALWPHTTPARELYTLQELVQIKETAGNRQEAERLAFATAKAGYSFALAVLVQMREEAGDREGVERLATAVFDAGYPSQMQLLVRQWEKAGEREKAEGLARDAVELGEPSCLQHLIWMRGKAGDRKEAERLQRLVVDAGHPFALQRLAEMRQWADDEAGARNLLRFGLEPDGQIADLW